MASGIPNLILSGLDVIRPDVPVEPPPVQLGPALAAIPRVLAALRALLLSDAPLVARLGTAPPALGGGPAIYTHGVVPAAARGDFLVLGPFSERSEATMGSGPKWGSEVAATVKLVTTNQDVGANLMTIDRIVALLHGVRLIVEGYSHGSSMLEVIVDSYEEKYAGVVFLHYPTVWTIHVGQPT